MLVSGSIYTDTSVAVVVGEGVTLQGVTGTTVTVASITVSGGGVAQNLTIDNIDVSGTAITLVAVDESSIYSAITFKNGNVTGGAHHGFFLGDDSVVTSGIGSVTIENAVFSGNATTESGAAGESAITIYRYHGNVSLKNVDVIGSNAVIENGIQIRGAATLAASGTLTFENVDVHGTFGRTGVAIRDFLSTTLAFNGANPALDVDVTAGTAYTGLHIDNVGGTVDLSGANAVDATHYPSEPRRDAPRPASTGRPKSHGG